MSKLCAIRDCTGRVEARHFCQSHYTRWIRHGHPLDGGSPRAHISDPEELLAVRRRETGAGCWEWTGPGNGHGYGRWSFSVNGRLKSVMVHRLAWELWRGPIPDGHHIDHLCRNRLCFNPSHLEPVTPAENNRRARMAAHATEASRHA